MRNTSLTLLVLLVSSFTSPRSPAQESQEPPLDFEGLKCLIERDLDRPGKPVVKVKLDSFKCHSRRPGDADLAKLKTHPDLREVVIHSDDITDAGLEHLKGLPKLEILHLIRTDDCVTDKGLEHVAAIPKLRELLLSHAAVTADGLAHLKKMPGLRKLHLARIPITSEGVAQLKELTKLETLGFSLLTLEDRAKAVELVCLLPNTTITFSGLLLGPGLDARADEAADAQAAVEALRRMGGDVSTGADKTALKVKFGCHAHINSAEFARIKALKNLEEFECIVALDDAQLENLRGQAGLRKLKINSQKVTDAGLAHLKTLSGLRDLSLRRSAYTADGLCDLAKGLEKLERLAFSQDGVTDDGLKCVKSLPTLRALSIYGSYSAVTDKGLVHLAGAKTLRSLSFYRVGITDEGLMQVQGLTELEELYLGEVVAVTDAGIGRLKAALPNLKVRR
jgi:hypothetical protein